MKEHPPDRHRIVSMAVLLLAVMILTILVKHSASSQSNVPAGLLEDPHYRAILENSQVRVFEVTIPPGQQTFVRSPHNLLTVALQDSQIAIWSDDQPISLSFGVRKGGVRFFGGGLARGTRNDANDTYNNVTVEFLNPTVTTYGYHYETGQWDYGTGILDAPTNPRAGFVNTLAMGTADARDVQLLPGDQIPASPLNVKELLIAVSDTESVMVRGSMWLRVVLSGWKRARLLWSTTPQTRNGL